MKLKNASVAVGLVAALSFAALPLVAADKDNDKATRQGRASFGHIDRANKIIGKEVRSTDNQKLGKIDNLIVDLESGRVLYAIIGSGGVAGVGEKKYAVAPALFSHEGDNLQVSVDKAKITSAPEFTRNIDKENELSKADYVHRVYQHYGQNPWWQGSKPAGEGSFNNVFKASELMGKNVENVSNQAIGEVENLAVDLAAGRVVFVILEPSPTLGLANNFYALPPDAFTRAAEGKKLATDLTKEKLASAPHFEKNNWAKLEDRSFASQVYQYYGKPAYFDGVQPTSDSSKERLYPEKKQ